MSCILPTKNFLVKIYLIIFTTQAKWEREREWVKDSCETFHHYSENNSIYMLHGHGCVNCVVVSTYFSFMCQLHKKPHENQDNLRLSGNSIIQHENIKFHLMDRSEETDDACCCCTQTTQCGKATYIVRNTQWIRCTKIENNLWFWSSIRCTLFAWYVSCWLETNRAFGK